MRARPRLPRAGWFAAAAALGLLLGAGPASAQVVPRDTTEAGPEVRPSEPIPIDTLAFGITPADTVPVLAPRFRQGEEQRELAAVPSEDVLPRNPRNAAIRAFLIPGWGQVYTGHPWRAVLFAAGEIGFGYYGWRWQQRSIDQRREIREARAAFADTTANLPEDPDERELLFLRQPGVNDLFAELEFIRERRQDFYAWAIASVIFAAIDAYVAAQLDPIEIDAEPETRRVSVGVELPLGRR